MEEIPGTLSGIETGDEMKNLMCLAGDILRLCCSSTD